MSTSLSFINQAWHLNISAGSNVRLTKFHTTWFSVSGTSGEPVGAFAPLRSWRLPDRTALFTLWLLGFGCYQLCKRTALTRTQGRTLLLFCSLCLGMTLVQFFSEGTPFEGGIIGFGQFFLVGIPFAGTIVGFAFADIPLARSRWATRIRWAAGATFTIYLLHFPLGMLVHALVPHTWPLAGRWFGIFSLLLNIDVKLNAMTRARSPGAAV